MRVSAKRVSADGPLGLGHVAKQAPPSPPLLPLSLHLGFFLSFSFFLFFFSMNTHRVHLKATVPHFTAAVGFSLLQFPLQFKWEKKYNRTQQKTVLLGLVSTVGRNLKTYWRMECAFLSVFFSP